MDDLGAMNVFKTQHNASDEKLFVRRLDYLFAPR